MLSRTDRPNLQPFSISTVGATAIPTDALPSELGGDLGSAFLEAFCPAFDFQPSEPWWRGGYEWHEEAFRRYCAENRMTFISEVADAS